MGNLDYIEQMGAGEPKATETTELEAKATTEDTPQDMLTDFEEQTSTSQTGTEVSTSEKENTVSPELLELKKQIEGMEKRINDKDAYIEELRESSKLREQSKQQDSLDNTDTDNESVDDDFWDDPVAYVNKMKDEFARTQHVQQMQINETHYANTVDDYWGTVNQENLLKAIKSDEGFADKFNTSKEPYKLAYEYLTEKKSVKAKTEAELREQIKREVMAELGKSPDTKKKETVPSTTNMGGNSGDTKRNDAEDGFMAVFGRK